MNHENYFWKTATGVNTDLARHDAARKKLEEQIVDFENRLLIEPDNEMTLRVLASYREFLNKLMESRVNVVSKIGRK